MEKHRTPILVAGILILALLVAACAAPATPTEEPTEEQMAEEPTEEPTEEQMAEEPTEEMAEEPTEEMAEEEEMTEPFRIAVVCPSAINDLAFSQSIYDAVTLIQEEMGGENAVEVAFSDNQFVVEDAAAAIRDYASEGYDLVIAHGSQYGGSLVEIAPEFPDTAFAWGTAGDTFADQGVTNVYAYEAASDEGGYVMGVMAAALSESGILGVVGPIEVGDAKLYVDGFTLGAEAQNPDVTVNINYIGSFSDVALASEAGQAQVNAGADVMTGTAQMVVGAIGVAAENNVLWFGTQANQTSLAPDIVVASQVYHWEVVLRDIIANIQGGTLGGEAFAINLENGGEVIEFNPDFDLPDDVRTLADETIAGIVDGSITYELPTE
jgi:basic membrane lipoprotein Med (substrate-binding protein (PBP1-ABC) superfamily)